MQLAGGEMPFLRLAVLIILFVCFLDAFIVLQNSKSEVLEFELFFLVDWLVGEPCISSKLSYVSEEFETLFS